MSTEIKVWEISEDKLKLVDANLQDAGRKEYQHLETWIESNPEIISSDIVFIGRQVPTKSGPLDLLGIDNQGNVVVVELKRDRLPREALAQSIDYASDIAEWTLEDLNEICSRNKKKNLEEYLTECFDDIDIENIIINGSQRIFLVGFGIDSSLERMINWLSQSYGVNINAVILKYVRTESGAEFLARVAIISEELERSRAEKSRRFKIEQSDVPGNYPEEELKRKLIQYLTSNLWSAIRLRKVVIPVLLKKGKATRDELKEELFKMGMADSVNQAGYFMALISQQISLAKNDFLRQVIGFECNPSMPIAKETYFIKEDYRKLLEDVLRELTALEK